MGTDKKLYSESEWTSSKGSIGIVISTESHSIMMFKNDSANTGTFVWGKEETISGCTTASSKSKAYQDFNGKANTDAIVSQYGSDTSVASAGEYADFSSNGYEWHLGTAGEWKMIVDNLSAVRSIINKIGSHILQTTGGYWTSTQASKTNAYVFGFETESATSATIFSDSKTNKHCARGFVLFY